MKIVVGSLLAFCLGAMLGWDWQGEREGEDVKSVVSSDRILVKKDDEVTLDPVWISWSDRISAAESGEDLKGIYVELEASELKGNAKLRKLICRRWVAIDPEAGVFALAGEGKLRTTFFAEWLAKDPVGAMAGIASLKDGAGKMKKLVLGELLAGEDFGVTLDFLRRTESFETAWGVKANEEWLKLIRARTDEMEELVLKVLEKEGRGVRSPTGRFLRELGRVKFEVDRELALEWGENFQEEGRRYVMEGLMRAWVNDDPFAVAAKFDEWREGKNLTHGRVFLMNSLGDEVARSLIGVDFSAGLAWLDHSGSFGGARAAGRLLGLRMKKGELSPEAVYDEIAKMRNPHEMIRREVLKDMWENMKPEDVSTLVGMLQGKEEGRTRTMAMSSLLKQALENSPIETAREFLKIPPGDDRNEVVAGILKGQSKDRLRVDFIQSLPLELRGTAVAAFYSVAPVAGMIWGYQPEIYPGVLAEGLPDLPNDGSRAEAMKRVGFHWGAIDPGGALEWVGGLSGDDQVAVMTEITRGWSQQNPRSVTDYLEGLEGGGIRDGAIAGLVAGVGEQDPESAWLWSEMIEGEEMRKEARVTALTWWAEVDAEAAREALEGGGLQKTEAEALRAILK